MVEILEHVLKKWEIQYGYLCIKRHSEWREFFGNVLNKNFALVVFDKKMSERKIDDQGRIYVGPANLKSFKTGEAIFIEKDEKGCFFVKRKK